MTSINFEFQKEFSFDKRKQEATRILAKYPDRVPVIVESEKKSTKTPDIDKHKYLIPRDMEAGQFIWVIRKRLGKKLAPDQTIFLFANGNQIPQAQQLIETLYQQTKHEDGFLYIKYSVESAFGTK